MRKKLNRRHLKCLLFVDESLESVGLEPERWKFKSTLSNRNSQGFFELLKERQNVHMYVLN